MKANVTLDREATIEILKTLGIDVRKTIKVEYEKIIAREVQNYCDKLIGKQIAKYTKYEVIDKIIKDAVSKVISKSEHNMVEAVNDINAEIRNYKTIALNQAKKYIRDCDFSSFDAKCIQECISKEVQKYFDKKLKG